MSSQIPAARFARACHNHLRLAVSDVDAGNSEGLRTIWDLINRPRSESCRLPYRARLTAEWCGNSTLYKLLHSHHSASTVTHLQIGFLTTPSPSLIEIQWFTSFEERVNRCQQISLPQSALATVRDSRHLQYSVATKLPQAVFVSRANKAV